VPRGPSSWRGHSVRRWSREFLAHCGEGAAIGAILHFWLNYYVTPGVESYFGKIVVGYIGGWLSPWVLGKWFPAITIQSVDIISAAVGTLAI
jgi:uncharacterized membrane protein YeaQ/YmgE (transglycosylase-associated protein family)